MLHGGRASGRMATTLCAMLLVLRVAYAQQETDNTDNDCGGGCLNGGVCAQDFNSQTFFCECPQSPKLFTGDRCQTPAIQCGDDLCYNDASCSQDFNAQTSTCTCNQVGLIVLGRRVTKGCSQGCACPGLDARCIRVSTHYMSDTRLSLPTGPSRGTHLPRLPVRAAVAGVRRHHSCVLRQQRHMHARGQLEQPVLLRVSDGHKVRGHGSQPDFSMKSELSGVHHLSRLTHRPCVLTGACTARRWPPSAPHWTCGAWRAAHALRTKTAPSPRASARRAALANTARSSLMQTRCAFC